MRLTITQRDITSELCQRCAACCRVTLTLRNTDSRYRVFLRTLGFSVLPAATDAAADCCDKVHDARIDTGDCPHLATDAGPPPRRRCNLYGSARYPALCDDYDCVSWARHDNTYHDGNPLLVAAQRALDELERERSGKPAKAPRNR